MQGITIPFVSTFMEENLEGLTELGRRMGSMKRLGERTALLHFHGRCLHHTKMIPGLLLRSHIVDALQEEGQDVQVSSHMFAKPKSFAHIA